MVSATFGTLTKGRCSACAGPGFVLYLRLSNPARLYQLCVACLEAMIQTIGARAQRRRR